jgi:hypothetical protein
MSTIHLSYIQSTPVEAQEFPRHCGKCFYIIDYPDQFHIHQETCVGGECQFYLPKRNWYVPVDFDTIIQPPENRCRVVVGNRMCLTLNCKRHK